MSRLSDAFIALPGRLGTLEELFEVLSWAPLGLHPKPIGILDVDGYYDQLLGVPRAHRSTEGFITAREPRTAGRRRSDDAGDAAGPPGRSGRRGGRCRQLTTPDGRRRRPGPFRLGGMELPVTPPLRPMLAKAVAELRRPPAGELLFEPKWDGFRCIVFRDGDEVDARVSRNDKPLTRYFPELLEPLRASLPDRCVVDGEIVVADATDGLDFDALQQRIHPAESRVNRLAEETPAQLRGLRPARARRRVDLRDAPLARAPRPARGGARRRRRHRSTSRPVTLRPRRGRATGSTASRAPGSTG